MNILSVLGTRLSTDALGIRAAKIIDILRDLGHNITVVEFGGNSSRVLLHGNRGNFQDIEELTRNKFPIVSQFQLLRVLSKCHFDLVYGNTHAGTFYSLPAYLMNLPIIFDMHGGMIEEFLLSYENYSAMRKIKSLRSYLIKKTVDVFDLSISSKVVCVSKHMQEYVIQTKRVPVEKTAYIPNGVDLDFFCPIPEKDRISFKEKLGLGGKLVFGYLGGAQNWQGLQNLFSAAEKINDEKIHFLIVANELNLKTRNILTLPAVERRHVKQYYAVCDILVLPRPSHIATEIAAPTKFSEYAAMGKPILTTNVGDASDLVQQYKCGVVIENNEPDTLVEGIKRVSGMSCDKFEEMGQMSRAMAEKEFNWNKFTTSISNLIQSLSKK